MFTALRHILKNRYPTSVALSGSYKSKKVVLKDDILDICKAELDSLQLFSEVGTKSTPGYDVVIEMNFLILSMMVNRAFPWL
jgi:hypothetical protein